MPVEILEKMGLETMSNEKGSLCISGVDICALAEVHQTPFYIYDLQTIGNRFSELKKYLNENIEIFYAVKANPNLAVCEYLERCGAGAEVASEGELALAIAAGYSPNRIIFNGPCKTEKILLKCIEHGVRYINVESHSELKRIEKCSRALGKDIDICIRINPIQSSRESAITTGGGPQKFGVDEDQLEQLIEFSLKSSRIKLQGIHVFEGSQTTNSKELGMSLPVVNLGGGIGVNYSHELEKFDIPGFGKLLNAAVDKDSSDRNRRYCLELGRSLVADSGVYVTRVVDVKKSGGENFAITDGGINHAMLPITRNQYPTMVINQLSSSSEKTYYIGGPLCTSADLSPNPLLLGDISSGDLIGMFKSGAYGYSVSLLYFLSFPTPLELIISNGKSFVARQAGSPEEFIRNQVGLPN